MAVDSNVDPAELAQFNAQAAHWWDRDGPMRALHQINPLRLQVIDRHIRLNGARVADVGCGGGILSEALAHAGAEVTAIDLSTQVLQVAREHARSAGLDIDYREQAAEDLAAELPGSFDLVCCMEMLEHVPAPESVISACARLLRPGGTAVFSTLNRHPRAFVEAIVGAEYLLNMVPRGTHHYRQFIRPSELARGCREAGLEVIDMRGLGYNPLSQSFRLHRDLRVNYFLSARKP
ncbi:MAG: bifunctional 2-polyprenyl-6-hydroxyphenol methylase/3-demethylubiquinol 3-O-methyltransferase UbiG [Oceanococcaceae bacterium]